MPALRFRFAAGGRESKRPCQAVADFYWMPQTCKTVQEFLLQPRAASRDIGIARWAALKPGPERALACARRERYSLVLRRSQSVTIFVGSTASLSISISTTSPPFSIRSLTRRAPLHLDFEKP